MSISPEQTTSTEERAAAAADDSQAPILNYVPGAEPASPGSLRPLVLVVFLTIAVFIAFAPMATWMEFPGGMEHYNVGTAVEILRNHEWLMPTLYGEPRTLKPPLTAWITAAGMLTSDSLEWGARWPTLLMAVLILPAIYAMGAVAGNRRLGLTAALVAASSYFFIKFARYASYDMQLTLWVTAADAFILLAIFRRKWWTGCVGAGIALGMALMTKGPPALLLTAVPPVVFSVLDWWLAARGAESESLSRRPIPWKPILAGVGLMLVIAAPWPVYVLLNQKDVLLSWKEEIQQGAEARAETRISWHSYLIFPAWMFPWTSWFVAGLAMAGYEWLRRAKHLPSSLLLRLMICWVIVPLLILSFFPTRRERYALPLLAPAAVLTAAALHECLTRLRKSDDLLEKLVPVQWILLAFVAIGLPIYGITSGRTVTGEHWFTPAGAIISLVLGVAILAATIRVSLRRPFVLVWGTAAMMLLAQTLFFHGYGRSVGGRSGGKVLANMILARCPDPIVYNTIHPTHRPLDLYIYLNRLLVPLRDAKTLTPSSRDQVVLYYREAGKRPRPDLVPIGSAVISKSWWDAYLLPAANDSKPP